MLTGTQIDRLTGRRDDLSDCGPFNPSIYQPVHPCFSFFFLALIFNLFVQILHRKSRYGIVGKIVNRFVFYSRNFIYIYLDFDIPLNRFLSSLQVQYFSYIGKHLMNFNFHYLVVLPLVSIRIKVKISIRQRKWI